MLKLIYQNVVFGPIELEYDRPVVRVGRSADNDLVLRHPSVEPYHCVLVFRDGKVLCLPPDHAITSHTDLRSLVGPEFSRGELIRIGEVEFRLERSSKFVTIPEIREASSVEAPGNNAPTGDGRGAGPRHYYCPQCRLSLRDWEVKRVGLVGHPKRCLCPKCSRVLETEPAQEPEPEPGKELEKKKLWSLGGLQERLGLKSRI